MSLSTILIIVLILALIGALPTWHQGGYFPAGGVALALIIVLFLVVLGVIR